MNPLTSSKKNEVNVVTFGTLDGEGNCQVKTTLKYISQIDVDGEIVPASSFEDCLLNLQNGICDKLIIPAAYPKLNHLYFKNVGNFKVTEAFIDPTPVFVLASNPKTLATNGSVIVSSHPAPMPLTNRISEILPEIRFTIKPALSNTNAAEMCSNCESHFCITNEIAASMFGLKVLHRFGRVDMGWLVWERN